MSAPWLARPVRWAASASDALFAGRVSILIFHRVQAKSDPLFPLEMHAERFDQLCALASRSFNVMTLGEAVAMRDAASLPPRALVITFDDGYSDNEQIALPILRRYGLPATFFVSTGFLDGGRMWNDTVVECVRATTSDALDLSAFELGRVPVGTVLQRRAAIDAILPKIKYRSLADRESLLNALWIECGRPELPGNLMMSSGQVRALHAANMEIGGHTVHHPILTELSDSDARREIEVGRATLQQLIQAPVDTFAYPNGRPNRDYDRRHVDMVKELGFRAAVSTAPGVCSPRAPRFELPRFTPWDIHLAPFMARLMLQRFERRQSATAGQAVP